MGLRSVQCSGERAGPRLPPEPGLIATEGCAEARRAPEICLPLGGIWGSPSLPSHPHSFASGWARAWCTNTGISLWDPGRPPGLLNPVEFTSPRLLAGRRAPSARLGRKTRKASPDSVEDPPWASLIFERRKEAEKRRARYWRKHRNPRDPERSWAGACVVRRHTPAH